MRRTAALAVVACLALPATASPAAAASPQTVPTTARFSSSLVQAVKALRLRPETRAGYDRDKFHLWLDRDGDGCDTREEVLIAESLAKVTKDKYCTITKGRWFSYYDRTYWTDPSDVDIDHLVPLAEAWDSGAKRWKAGTRDRYANDLRDYRTLVAVTDNVNASKGDQDIAEWLPQYSRCRYARQWVAVKIRWHLTVNRPEKRKLRALASRCGGKLTVRRAVVHYR